MKMRTSIGVLCGVLCVAFGSAACGLGESLTSSLDAGPSGSCAVEIELLSSQDPIFAPATIDAQASISITGNLSGAERFAWSLEASDQGAIPAIDEIGDFAERVSFAADRAASYRLVAQGSVSGVDCLGDDQVVNVRVPGANRASYWLRAIPAAGQAAITSDQLIEVWGGVGFDLGELAARAGVPVAVQITASDGADVPAYVQVKPQSRAPAMDLHTDSQGAFEVRLDLQQSHDFLVVPQGDNAALVAPVSSISAGGLLPSPSVNVRTLPAGLLVSGTVRDPDMQLMAGARVALRPADLPAAVVHTDALGGFSAQIDAESGSDLEAVITPPEASGLPALRIPLGAGVGVGAGGRSLDIRFANPTMTSVASARVVASDNATPLAGARVTWIAESVPNAGTVRVDGGPAISIAGTVRVSREANTDGDLPSLDLPAVSYDVLVDPPAGSGEVATLVAVDLAAGAPATLATSQPGRVQGSVLDGRGAAIAGARVAATPLDLMANSPTASHTAITASDGTFQLDLPANSRYDLAIKGPNSAHGRQRLTADTPAPGQTAPLAAVTLPDTLRYTGKITLDGDGLAGMTLHLLCVECAGPDADLPIAEATSDGSGTFTIYPPDPGSAASQ